MSYGACRLTDLRVTAGFETAPSAGAFRGRRLAARAPSLAGPALITDHYRARVLVIPPGPDERTDSYAVAAQGPRMLNNPRPGYRRTGSEWAGRCGGGRHYRSGRRRAARLASAHRVDCRGGRGRSAACCRTHSAGRGTQAASSERARQGPDRRKAHPAPGPNTRRAPAERETRQGRDLGGERSATPHGRPAGLVLAGRGARRAYSRPAG